MFRGVSGARGSVLLTLITCFLLIPSAGAVTPEAGAGSRRSLESDFQVLQGHFRRTVVEKALADSQTVIGSFIYVPGGRVRIIIEKPLRQELCIDEQGMLVYYPDKRDAIRILDPGETLAFRFIQIAHRSSLPDFDLGAEGAVLIDYAVRGDTLESRWAGPENTPWHDQRFTLTAVENRLLCAAQRLSDGTLMMEIELSNHLSVGAMEIPQHFVLHEHREVGSRIEELEFWDLEVDATSPDSVGALQLPAGMEPEIVEW